MNHWGPYPAVVTDWHDGDTCHVNLDLGFSVYLYGHDLDGKPLLSVRLQGVNASGQIQPVNAPELSTDAGKAALAYVQQLCPSGTHVMVLSTQFDKYGGRFDATITLPSGADLGAAMVAAGQAVWANY